MKSCTICGKEYEETEENFRRSPIAEDGISKICLNCPSQNYSKWTQQATECYVLEQDCSKCSVRAEGYTFECKMPVAVQHLLNKTGRPPMAKVMRVEEYREDRKVV